MARPWWNYKEWTPRSVVEVVRERFLPGKPGERRKRVALPGRRPETRREYRRRLEVADTGHALARARKLRKRHLRGRSVAIAPTRKEMQRWEKLAAAGEAGPAPTPRRLPQPGGHGKPGKGIVGYRG